MRLGKTLLIIIFFIIIAWLYWEGAVKQLTLVNTDMQTIDQSAYMRYSRSMRESGYSFIGRRNQMPVYPFLQSLFLQPGMNDDAFFLTGKYVNLVLSIILLAAIGIILKKTFHWLHALVLFLIFTFTVFIFKAGFFQSELLFYFLNLCLFLFMFKLLRAPSWPMAILAGVVAGLAHLTKASILPGLLVFLVVAAIKSGWAIYKNWRSRPRVDPGKQWKLNLLVVPLVMVSFLITVFPYIQTSKRVYGSYFFNVNSTYYIWYDSWEAVKADIKADAYQNGRPSMPADEVPSLSRYLREHNLKDILRRIRDGSETIIENMSSSYGYLKYLLIFSVALVLALLWYVLKYKKFPAFDLFNLFFLAAYFGGYYLLYSFYVPIAQGNRLILSIYMPAMFILAIGLQETLKTSGIKLFKRQVPALSIFDGAMMLILLVDIYFILTVRIVEIYGGR